MQLKGHELDTIPVGSLGLITLKGCEELGTKINDYIVDWRQERVNEHIAAASLAETLSRFDARLP